jgi:hypothetical protein
MSKKSAFEALDCGVRWTSFFELKINIFYAKSISKKL